MTEQLKGSVTSLVEESKVYPLEKLASLKRGGKSLTIGLPKETSTYENRIGLTPKGVETLTNQGHKVLVQCGSGLSSNFSDEDYSSAGANITNDAKEVFKSDVVIKVEYPTTDEIGWLSPGNTLISTIHRHEKNVKRRLCMLNEKKITAIGYELLEDNGGGLPIVRAMSEIAGSVVMPLAADYLAVGKGHAGVILGGITGVPPTNIVIIGAGTVTEYAARTALGFGASVKVFDQHLYKLHRLKQILSASIFTSTIDNVALRKALEEADVVIAAVRSERGILEKVITEDMVRAMKKGAVIIDVSIDEGGIVETSRPTNLKNPVFVEHDVIHYCVPNIASLVPRTSTKVLSNIFVPILSGISKVGGVDQMIYQNSWFMKGVYAYKGFLTNVHLAEKFRMNYKDLNLLMAARF
ncbi:alanine dehydrogenase [Reichenbachiella versicolor]|uniref:alanine dehydrogenase n=1 Tax=Reichenbachiella versicolor TaxID=1821036 RepID=UPI001623E3EE|nr:alanine dehydrogenase [Reichenbachiella versicolor]